MAALPLPAAYPQHHSRGSNDHVQNECQGYLATTQSIHPPGSQASTNRPLLQKEGFLFEELGKPRRKGL